MDWREEKVRQFYLEESKTVISKINTSSAKSVSMISNPKMVWYVQRYRASRRISTTNSEMTRSKEKNKVV